MNRLWPKDTSRPQKWLVWMMLLILIGALVPMLQRSFVPSPAWQVPAAYLSGLLMAGLCAWLRHLHRRGLWQPGEPWPSYGPIKRILMPPLMLAMAFFILWLNIAATLPMAYTAWLGQDSTRLATVEKKRGTGRYSCRSQLKVQEIRYPFFEFCIDSEDFEALPSGPMPAMLEIRQSRFGERIAALRMARPEPH